MIKKKVCWKITTKCNQGCKYCFGFNNIDDLSFNDNLKVLKNLKNSGINHITWTGGEAVLYPRVDELMEKAKEYGIHNKLVTNGIFLSKDNSEKSKKILNNLEEINLSIDSINNKINIALGKENNHFEIIKNLLEKIKDKPIKIGINTVVSKINIEKIDELGEFLNNYNIEKWKFLKFMPIREKSLKNKELFEISEEELINKVNALRKYENIKIVQYKKQDEFEKSLVVLPNAEIIKTERGIDIKKGNALDKNIKLFNEKVQISKKIKAFVFHNNDEIRNSIVNSINSLGFIELVGTASSNKEAYEKIIDLKPNIVFATYSLELIKKTKETLKEQFPSFNTIGEIPDSDLLEVAKITGSKLNAALRLPYDTSVKNILNSYNKE